MNNFGRSKVSITNIDRYELEQAILGEDRNNKFVARFGVVVQQRKTACVCLHEKS